jgi:hypothetical protein
MVMPDIIVQPFAVNGFPFESVVLIIENKKDANTVWYAPT